MCGRFGVSTPENIEERFNTMGDILDIKPSYNIAPSYRIPVITRNSPNKAQFMIWGFIPSWADPKSSKIRPINARSDSLAKPFYRDAFKTTRCIIPFSFYYEWKKFVLDGKEEKVPYLFKVKGSDLMGFAGLYSVQKDAEGIEVLTCCIITTEPNSLTKKVHNRMPLILEQENEDIWLNQDTETQKLNKLLKPYPADYMESWRVSTLVNYPKHDDVSLINKVD